jgi:hypothetical protein
MSLQKRVRVAGLLGLIALVACAHSVTNVPPPSASQTLPPPVIETPPHEVVQDDWIVIRAAKEGPREVITRQEYAARRARGLHMRTSASLQRKPPLLLDVASPVRVSAGDVKTFMLEDAPVKRIVVSGGSAEAFWTKPYAIRRMESAGVVSEHEGSDLHIKGDAPGRCELQVEFTDGRPARTIEIDVRPTTKPIG